MRSVFAIAAFTTLVLLNGPSLADIVNRTNPPPTAPNTRPKTIEGTKSSEGPSTNTGTQTGGVKSSPIEPVTVRFPTKR